MIYRIEYTGKFNKALKKCYKRGLNIEILREVIRSLETTGKVDSRHKPLKLSGNYAGCWECHLQNDWLLVWRQDDDRLILLLLDTGSHSDVFG